MSEAYKPSPWTGLKTSKMLAKHLFLCRSFTTNSGVVRVRGPAWSEMIVDGRKIAIFRNGVLRITLAGRPHHLSTQRRLLALGAEITTDHQGNVLCNGKKISPKGWYTMKKTAPKTAPEGVVYTPKIKLTRIPSDYEQVKITSPSDAADYIRKFYEGDLTLWESVFILLLDQENKTTGFAKISQGGVTGTVVDPKIVAHYAVSTITPNVILAHNHPSGNLRPSDADIRITRKIKEGLSLFDIKLVDHIILTEESFTSLNGEGFV